MVAAKARQTLIANKLIENLITVINNVLIILVLNSYEFEKRKFKNNIN